jgi:hypothetical protein
MHGPAVTPEDRMQDAVALVERIELRGRAITPTIEAGFRSDGRLSLFFGDDPYYQFDPEGRLRRAFVDGQIFLTTGSGLKSLTRGRGTKATILVRHDLASTEAEQFLRTMLDHVGRLRQAIASGDLHTERQVPAKGPIVQRLCRSLEAIVSANGALAPPINRTR